MDNENLELTANDWNLLRELREWFLSEKIMAGRDYWQSEKLLELYHRTFAQRIGWKWDAVLSESKVKSALLKDTKWLLVDYGCGTGIATEKIIEHLGEENILSCRLWDYSQRAREFAQQRLNSKFPKVKIELGDQSLPKADNLLFCISHVLTELAEEKVNELLSWVDKAKMVLWVEPGTSQVSQRLISVRERLMKTMSIIAPCTHSNSCGMLNINNQQHWCHFFAPPPAVVFQSRFWRNFSDEMKIDLRSLPTSYLVFIQKALEAENPSVSRVLGRPRIYKGFGKFLLCDSDGVNEAKLLKRDNQELFKDFKKEVFSKEIQIK